MGNQENYRKELEVESNEKVAKQNLDFQKEKLEYDKQLQQQIFNREDSAYQRTVKDMRSAGVSPLAMQGTNGAGAVVTTEAPQNGMVYDYTSGMSTDAEKFNTLIGAIGQISSVMSQSEQVRSLKLQNDFTEKTLNHRVAREQAETILSKYNALDARDKRYFNNIFAVNPNMPREQQLANITATLAMKEEDFNKRIKQYSGTSLRDFEDSNYDFSKMLSYGSYDKRHIRELLDTIGSEVQDNLGIDKITNSDKRDIYGNSNSDKDKEILDKVKRGEKLNPFEQFIYYLYKKGIK